MCFVNTQDKTTLESDLSGVLNLQGRRYYSGVVFFCLIVFPENESDKLRGFGGINANNLSDIGIYPA